ncbi:hypothetical protein [Chryseobacterium sp. SIMBA_038]|uniref:hypothetical protein n=1 Tax=Chryseobacterium sp. SIMBA_038 TaxID=3085780 RepID=UPI00397DCD13
MKSLTEFINEQLENSIEKPIQEEQQIAETTQTNIQEAEQPNPEQTPSEEK